LFREIVDVLSEKQPKYFLLENVKRLLSMERGSHFATILSSLAELNYHIEWRLLNAMHLGLPQNRQRVFILGVHASTVPGSGFRFNERVIVRLASADDLAGNKRLGSILCEPSEWQQIERHGTSFPSWGMARSGRFIGADLDSFSSALTPVMLRDVLEKEVAPEFDFTETTLKWIESNTPVNRFIQGVEIISNQGGGARMGYTIFGINGVAPTLTSTTSRHYERYRIGDRFRRLTNVEYARIQGFPDDYCSVLSVYDQYALLGNAVPPPMAKWVMERVCSDGLPADEIPFLYRDLFSNAQERTTT
jgi:DNA (cytosine-5)-methyltransferase 1